MGYRHAKMILLSSCAIALCGGLQPAAAQVEDEGARSGGLEDIVVTARRRAESVQTTPLSVSAFDSRSLQDRGLQNIADVSRAVPNVQLDPVANESGVASTQISIRGIGQTDYVLTVEPGVAVYLDGVYVGKSLGSLLDTVDVERVEILRGPQGTLFGKNTIGGAIQVITKRPTADNQAEMELTTGRYDRLDARGAMSGPITDWLRFRLSASYQSRDGFMKRILRSGERTGEVQGDMNRLGGRLVFEADVAPNLLATLAFDGTRIREKSPATYLRRVTEDAGFPRLFNLAVPGGVCAPAAGASRFSNPYCFNDQYSLPTDTRVTYNAGGNTADTDVRGVALTLDWKPGDINVKSITSFRKVDVFVDQNLGGSAYYNSQVGQDIDFKSFSQEYQLSGNLLDKRLSYVLGAYYQREWGRQLFPVQTALAQFLSGGDIKNDSYAAFGQLTYEITSRLSLTGGFRYTYETRRFNPGLQHVVGYDDLSVIKIPGFVNPVANAFGAPGTPLFPAGWYKRNSKAGTPMISLSYKPVDDVMLYATYAKGFKGGGFTMRFFPPVRPAAGVDPDTLIPYAKPEKATSYEAGIKSEWLGGKLRLNVAGFITDYNNIQVTYTIDPDGPGPIGRFLPVLANSGSARIKGIEVEGAAVPTDWLRIDGSLGYIDAKYRKFTAAAIGAYPAALGFDLPNTPKWTYNVGTTVTFFDNESGNVFLRADWGYRSSQFKEFSNNPSLFQKGYGILNAGLTYRSADRNWDVTLGGTNLTDKAYIVSGVASSDRAQAVRSRPREWYLTLRHKI